MTRIVLIDNYDSFTWNLVHLIAAQGPRVHVVRNDKTDVAGVLAQAPDAIVVSPGPCTPNEAGISVDLVRAAGSLVPVLGVCLGHQAIGQAFGGEVARAPVPLHGKVSRLVHDGTGLFADVPSPFEATRYHSLIVRRESLPPELVANAETEDGVVMGLAHRTLPVHGVQFHPESIASEHGERMIANFLRLVAAWHGRPPAAAFAPAGRAPAGAARP